MTDKASRESLQVVLIYGQTASGEYRVIQVDADGKVVVTQ